MLGDLAPYAMNLNTGVAAGQGSPRAPAWEIRPVVDCRRLDLAGATVVAVRGDVDLATVPKLRAELMRAVVTGAEDLYVDLRDVEFINSCGIRLLLEIQGVAEGRSGSLRLRAPCERVLEVLRLSGALVSFDVVSSR